MFQKHCKAVYFQSAFSVVPSDLAQHLRFSWDLGVLSVNLLTCWWKLLRDDHDDDDDDDLLASLLLLLKQAVSSHLAIIFNMFHLAL